MKRAETTPKKWGQETSPDQCGEGRESRHRTGSRTADRVQSDLSNARE